MQSQTLHTYYLILQKVVFYGWLLSCVILLTLIFLQPSFFSKEFIVTLLEPFEMKILLIVYFLICIIRGLFLLPSTPFILAGVVIFSGQEGAVFVLSLTSILISASLIYRFSEYLGLEAYFARKYPKRITQIESKINTRYGFWFLVLWSFFPLVPTDLMCYVAGTIRMRFQYFIFAVALGEIPLILMSVYGFEYLERLFVY